MTTWMFDLDEILCDFSTFLIETTNQYFNLSLNQEDFHKYYLYDVLDLPKEEIAPIFEITGRFENIVGLPVLLDGLTLAQFLKNKNDQIHIITARSKDMKEATEVWLKMHQVPHDSLSMTDSQPKDSIAKNLKVEFAIEDNPKHATILAETGITVFVPEYPWNRGKLNHKNIIPVKNCSEIFQHLC